ncbi:MAG: hypothetical protein H6732_18535 [Alphaproteobacteria bacterium]|nr:hypothetical protein [Alphaproteobacteria bacterium]
MSPAWGPAWRAALRYVALVFAAGFVLGTVRTLVLVPRLGETAAVLLELPVMLTVSWAVCARAVRREGVSPAHRVRLAMGSLALVLLLLAEVALGLTLFGRTGAEVLAGFGTVPGGIGLAGQVAFGLVPLLQGLRETGGSA